MYPFALPSPSSRCRRRSAAALLLRRRRWSRRRCSSWPERLGSRGRAAGRRGSDDAGTLAADCSRWPVLAPLALATYPRLRWRHPLDFVSLVVLVGGCGSWAPSTPTRGRPGSWGWSRAARSWPTSGGGSRSPRSASAAPWCGCRSLSCSRGLRLLLRRVLRRERGQRHVPTLAIGCLRPRRPGDVRRGDAARPRRRPRPGRQDGRARCRAGHRDVALRPRPRPARRRWRERAQRRRAGADRGAVRDGLPADARAAPRRRGPAAVRRAAGPARRRVGGGRPDRLGPRGRSSGDPRGAGHPVRRGAGRRRAIGVVGQRDHAHPQPRPRRAGELVVGLRPGDLSFRPATSRCSG